MGQFSSAESHISDYSNRLQAILSATDWSAVAKLAQEMMKCWRSQRQVFICGNGGSAGNAIHLANDFLYGIAKKTGSGLKINALSANSAVLTCLANDIGYEHIYSEQIAVLSSPGDLLIALSGSGNSKNIINAIEQANKMSVVTSAILGFSGGVCKRISSIPIHFPVDDMQIAEDLQLIVGHMLMQWMYINRVVDQDS
ncbi:SIS domain-containing protein [Polynucleobacter sp. MG-6-Vaara-E2]|uniref:SIS domain-containing protein n=1 Tax=Polynucleobacter sp. MG-6-Vaara-E2 TaxID=2576932 RepID=UPI001BFDA8CD|nr:SIS domain-containing protein [Polynucleobacter sp. MG-6-Vaara-E2]QWD96903.1 SIS domain-containing protein [Polynucleobacter sp. MG-6-Vaara-E2]